MRRAWIGLALVAMACGTTEPDDESLFFTRRTNDGPGMEALFRGIITVDASGCFRLGGLGAVMIWPAGYSLRPTIEGAAVFDDTGAELQRIGSEFVFSGGVVETLQSGVLVSESARIRALTRCPGPYFISNRRSG